MAKRVIAGELLHLWLLNAVPKLLWSVIGISKKFGNVIFV